MNQQSITSSLRIRNTTLSSRFFLAPINTGFAYKGEPTKRFMNFYENRSGNLIGITYIGNVSIGSEYCSNKYTSFFSNKIDNWKLLAYGISKNNSVPAIQLGCRLNSTTPSKLWETPDKENYINQTRNIFLNLPTTFFYDIAEKFSTNALFAINAGYKLIQIHAAHGYFLSQVLSNTINTRKDEFGKDKLLLIKLITDKIRKYSSKCILDMRLSFFEGFLRPRIESEEKRALLEEITNLDIDIISISNGFYDLNKSLVYPPKKWGHGTFIPLVSSLAISFPSLYWNVVGNIWNLKKIPDNLPSNLTFSIGRSLIADPKLIQEYADDDFSSIIECERCEKCHYYINGLHGVSCPLNLNI